jgi:hypothetical protein
MGRRSHHTFAKRQRDLKKAEKVADKKARRAHRKSGVEEPTAPPDGSSSTEDGHDPVDADGSDRADGEQPADGSEAPPRPEGET